MEQILLQRGDIELPVELHRAVAGGAEARPGILLAVGGLGRGEPDAYRWAGERFASAGYTTLVASYSAPRARSDVEDLTVALDRLAADRGVDAARLALFGHSRGALSGLLLAASDPRIRAIVSIATPANIAQLVRNMSIFAPAAAAFIAQFLGGMPDEAPQIYAALDSGALARRIRQPMLLMHGTADMRAPLEYAKDLKEALSSAGNADVSMELLAGVGHNLELGVRGYQFDQVVELAAAWLSPRLR